MINRRMALAVGLLVGLSGCARVGVAPPAPNYRVLVVNEWSPLLWSNYETQIIDMVNAERTKQGLARLVVMPALRTVARNHSKDMATRLYSTHVSPDGKGPADRLKAAGVPFTLQGEVVGMLGPTSNLANTFMYATGTGWMNTPAQWANILHPRFTRIGVGVWETNSGNTYSTLVFARP
jgi:uncharacterized protein YkwD